MYNNQQTMINIGFLSEHLDTIPTLTKWFRAQWPDYYADWSDEEMEQNFLEDISRDCIPSRLVAFESNELAGTIVLRDYVTDVLPELQPGLGGLFVAESYRNHGIGAELVRAGMKLAANQGYKKIYATTETASSILERLGWEFLQMVKHQDGQLALYRCKL